MKKHALWMLISSITTYISFQKKKLILFKYPCCKCQVSCEWDNKKKMKREFFEVKLIIVSKPDQCLFLVFQTDQKPAPAYFTQTSGGVTRSSCPPSCPACTTVWLNSARSFLEPMQPSAVKWRYNPIAPVYNI